MAEDLFNATLVTILAVGGGYLSKKVFKESLDTPTTFKGFLKFNASITLGVISLNLLRHYELMPFDIKFKRTEN